LEYLKGGEVFAKIGEKGNYSEADAAKLMKKLLEAISYCHSKHFIHRDLKLENLILMYEFKYINNIILKYRDDKSDIDFKIIDFGLANKLEENQLEIRRCGSPGYVAPEILIRRGHSFNADVFSCGVILFYLYILILLIAI